MAMDGAGGARCRKRELRPPRRIAAMCFTRRRKEGRGPTRLLVSLLIKGLGRGAS
jgi:hypothetical protein